MPSTVYSSERLAVMNQHNSFQVFRSLLSFSSSLNFDPVMVRANLANAILFALIISATILLLLPLL